MQTPLPYADDIEVVPTNENDDIRALIDVLRRILLQTAEQTGEHRRDVHAKGNGCALGELQVLPVGEPLAQGLFSRAGHYPVIVRFSNSSPFPQADAIPDGRGLAIQVHNVSGPLMTTSDGPIQNFVMVNHPTFIVPAVKDYLAIEQARVGRNKLNRVLQLLTRGRTNPLSWRWNSLSAVASIFTQPPAHPAAYTYYSMVPFRFGNWIAKYRVTLESRRQEWLFQTAIDSLRHSDAMRRTLAETLRNNDLIMSFEVQLRTSENKMPIEDASVEWPQNESPYRQVGRLILPRQDIDLPSTQRINDASFNVWHGLVDHRPLGGINRLRRQVYDLSASWRQSKPFEWHTGKE